MDFASLMKAELDAKKAKLNAAKAQAGKSYMKQKDIREAEAEAKKRKTEDKIASDEAATKKSKLADGAVDSPKVTPAIAGSVEKGEVQKAQEEKKISQAGNLDIMRQLRERNEPVRLFGETDQERRARLQYIKTHESSEDKGYRNDFMEAVDKVNEQYLQDFLKQNQQDEESQLKEREKRLRDHAMLEEVTRKEVEDLYNQKNEKDNVFILRSIQYLLMVWEAELDQRPPSELDRPFAKRETAIYHQTISYLEPLIQKLTKNDLGDDLSLLMTEIFRQMYERNYVQAADMYLRMAIGNAAWPIGVTMVGIHARTGREKIYSQHVAHVLNDETQRKYIQALKRLMTLAQRVFPAAPSRCLEYGGIVRG